MDKGAGLFGQAPIPFATDDDNEMITKVPFYS